MTWYLTFYRRALAGLPKFCYGQHSSLMTWYLTFIEGPQGACPKFCVTAFEIPCKYCMHCAEIAALFNKVCGVLPNITCIVKKCCII